MFLWSSRSVYNTAPRELLPDQHAGAPKTDLQSRCVGIEGCRDWLQSLAFIDGDSGSMKEIEGEEEEGRKEEGGISNCFLTLKVYNEKNNFVTSLVWREGKGGRVSFSLHHILEGTNTNPFLLGRVYNTVQSKREQHEMNDSKKRSRPFRSRVSFMLPLWLFSLILSFVPIKVFHYN